MENGTALIVALTTGSLSLVAAVFSGLVMLINTRSAARLAEVKASLAEQGETLDTVHVLTNKNYEEQRLKIAEQASELKDLRAAASRLEATLLERLPRIAAAPAAQAPAANDKESIDQIDLHAEKVEVHPEIRIIKPPSERGKVGG